MKGIPLALDAERSPMLELLVIGNLECIYYFVFQKFCCPFKIVLFCEILKIWCEKNMLSDNIHGEKSVSLTTDSKPHLSNIRITICIVLAAI